MSGRNSHDPKWFYTGPEFAAYAADPKPNAALDTEPDNDDEIIDAAVELARQTPALQNEEPVPHKIFEILRSAYDHDCTNTQARADLAAYLGLAYELGTSAMGPNPEAALICYGEAEALGHLSAGARAEEIRAKIGVVTGGTAPVVS